MRQTFPEISKTTNKESTECANNTCTSPTNEALDSRHTTYFSIEARSRVLLLMKIYNDGGSSDFHLSVSTPGNWL